MYDTINMVVLFEDFYATEKVAAFYLFAVAKVEFGAEGSNHYCRYQIPPFYRTINNSNSPVYYTTD